MQSQSPPSPPIWCNVCSLDLQSSKSLSEHKTGRKHRDRAYQQTSVSCSSRDKLPPSYSFSSNSRFALSIQLPPLFNDDSETPEIGNALTELFQNLATGTYRNIVVCTGAGVSTAAGVPDFRSAGGLFERIGREFGDRFPEAKHNPEWMLSRSFARQYPHVWENIVLPRIQADYNGLQPTLTHRFCAWLHWKGWLRRVYTQNVDGLHLHPSLNLPTDLVVECHG